MQEKQAVAPERTAERVALWRAMHVQVDPPPHVLEDEVGLRLLSPDESWRRRPDMDPRFTGRARASIVARSRFIEDLVAEEALHGVQQYVLLGAGLDTFAQRRPEVASRLRVFEVDQPGPQAWKQQRLRELGYGLPEWLRFVPVDFEAGGSWWDQLIQAGFDPSQPAIVTSTGVSMYLTREAIGAMLRQCATLAPGSRLVMTFAVPVDLVEADERPLRLATEKGARAGGTPWISVFPPHDMVAMAREAGFREAKHVSSGDLAQRYFGERPDGLRPSSSEELMVAST